MDWMKCVWRGRKKNEKLGKRSLQKEVELGVALLAVMARKTLQTFKKKEENLFSVSIHP